jgi:hypothetical protein
MTTIDYTCQKFLHEKSILQNYWYQKIINSFHSPRMTSVYSIVIDEDLTPKLKIHKLVRRSVHDELIKEVDISNLYVGQLFRCQMTESELNLHNNPIIRYTIFNKLSKVKILSAYYHLNYPINNEELYYSYDLYIGTVHKTLAPIGKIPVNEDVAIEFLIVEVKKHLEWHI